MTNINEVREILSKKILEEKSGERTIELPPIFYKENKVSMVSLFCGAGGLDLGAEWAGTEVGMNKRINIADKDYFEAIRKNNVVHTVYATDKFTEAIATYSEHFKETVVHKADIKKIKDFPKADLYTFGFPCPGFSLAGPRLVDDDRNFEYIHCCRALLQAQPKVFIAENVKGLMTLGGGLPYAQIKEDFEAAGYNIYTKLLNSRDYGVPQIRERVIMVGVRKDLDFIYEFPKPTHGEGNGLKPFTTLKRAIWDLKDKDGWYYKGTYSSKYMGRNRKKTWDQQSFTIQADGRQAPVHPEGKPMIKIDSEHWEFPNEGRDDRRLTVDEAARVQTFPDWFKFNYGKESVSHNTKVNKMFKQIGNAVPVLMAKVIAKPIIEFLNELRQMEQENTLVSSNEVSEQVFELPVSAISSFEKETISIQSHEQVSVDEVLNAENIEQPILEEVAPVKNYAQLSIDEVLAYENNKQDITEEVPSTKDKKRNTIEDVNSNKDEMLNIIEEATSVQNQKQLSFDIFM
ncbi:DNA (cytosine-5-)-methyltransferase [Priestia megaterium]|uniref:DNA cytosine methyltransferase n=1 Tax=Priestia megaterium TaxID=1404 RepID=UPI002E1EED87|nr:DNA (cytosine-5-)-methyltransferase [Priestia megaterium]MED4285452.1 DNA (cytosine-5-)-methyltransferase [Priestia megaterium]